MAQYRGGRRRRNRWSSTGRGRILSNRWHSGRWCSRRRGGWRCSRLRRGPRRWWLLWGFLLPACGGKRLDNRGYPRILRLGTRQHAHLIKFNTNNINTTSFGVINNQLRCDQLRSTISFGVIKIMSVFVFCGIRFPRVSPWLIKPAYRMNSHVGIRRNKPLKFGSRFVPFHAFI